MTKYIFVTGGVVSGLGKGTGITAASLGRLESKRAESGSAKLDPYINVDPVVP